MKDIIVAPINTDQANEASKQSEIVLNEVRAIAPKISNQSEYESAGGFLQNIKGRIKSLDTLRKGITKPLDEAKANVMALFRKPLENYEEAESLIKQGMLIYSGKQERLRQIEQEKLDRIAEVERQKKSAQEAEWRRKEEEARKEADRLAMEASKIKNATARAEAEARAAKAKAEADKAAAKADERALEQQNIIAPVAAPKVEAIAGTSYRDQWSAIITNAELVPNDYKIVDIAKLNKVANATKGTIDIPGVTWKKEKILSSRSK